MSAWCVRLCGGPADGLTLDLDHLPDTIEQPEPHPGRWSPDPALYRLRTQVIAGQRRDEPLLDAYGAALYAYDWHTEADWHRQIPLTADQPPNSRGDRY